jgi:hypothetical protein
MALTSALLVALALGAAPERILLCRPQVTGDPSLARADALAGAGRGLADRYLDYRIPCEATGEAARAAGRAGLHHGLYSSAQAQPEGSAYLLVLVSQGDEEVARRALTVPPGADAEARLREALRELAGRVPQPPARWTGVAGWALLGAGAAALAAGGVLAVQARDQARRANQAATPGEYQAARDAWKGRRLASGVALGGGGAAVVAGLTLRLAF